MLSLFYCKTKLLTTTLWYYFISNYLLSEFFFNVPMKTTDSGNCRWSTGDISGRPTLNQSGESKTGKSCQQLSRSSVQYKDIRKCIVHIFTGTLHASTPHGWFRARSPAEVMLSQAHKRSSLKHSTHGRRPPWSTDLTREQRSAYSYRTLMQALYTAYNMSTGNSTMSKSLRVDLVTAIAHSSTGWIAWRNHVVEKAEFFSVGKERPAPSPRGTHRRRRVEEQRRVDRETEGWDVGEDRLKIQRRT